MEVALSPTCSAHPLLPKVASHFVRLERVPDGRVLVNKGEVCVEDPPQLISGICGSAFLYLLPYYFQKLHA